MRKAIKLGLLTVVASVILALPVTASAEISSRGEPLPTTPRTEVIYQAPLEIKGYLGTVDLLPEGVGISNRELPAEFKIYGVKSIEITGPLSNLVQAYTWKPQYDPYNLGKVFISFYSLGGATTVMVKVTNNVGGWGYYIVNVSPPVVDHLLGTVTLHPTKSSPDSVEMTLPEFLQHDVGLSPVGLSSQWVKAEITNNGSKIKFNTSVMSKSTTHWKVTNNEGEFGYYIINVIPKDYRIQPPLFINL